jgi:hypothetical protein
MAFAAIRRRSDSLAIRTVEALASQVPGLLTHDGFGRSYRALGTAYDPVTTFQIDFAAGRNDSAALYRPYAFDSGCGCMACTGPPVAIPR